MPWIELACEIDEQTAPTLSDRLESLGALAVSYYDASGVPLLEPAPGETPFWNRMKVVGLFDASLHCETLLETLAMAFPTLTFDVNALADQEWTRTWLTYFTPRAFGDRLWVMPSHVAVVKLDPGLAFGTGTHPTTALCLQWLNNHPMPDTVIDYGCGSGILGIAAQLLGAKTVWAVDYDPQALLSARDNALRNGLSLEHFVTVLPDELPTPLAQASLVMANILAEPLIALAPRFTTLCLPGGTLVLSGLLANQIDAVATAYQEDFICEPAVIQEGWGLLCATRR